MHPLRKCTACFTELNTTHRPANAGGETGRTSDRASRKVPLGGQRKAAFRTLDLENFIVAQGTKLGSESENRLPAHYLGKRLWQ